MKCICVECNNEFEAKHKTALCPKCKSTPLKCVICGKEFPKTSFPYNQKTCSAKCRGKYRAQSGIAKEGAAKMLQTKLDRYGTVDPTSVAKERGTLATKTCPLCGKQFQPRTVRQVYCEDKHYGPCPVCGKPVEIKDYNIGPQACSEECRMARINATCLERYGNKDAVNSEHAKELAKQHSLERYGKEYYSQTDEYHERYAATSLQRFGTSHPMQNAEVKEKAAQTNINKYGSKTYSQSEEGKKKIIATNEKLYGGTGLASPEIRNKIIATNMEKYGCEYPFENNEIRQKIKDNNLEKYGTEWAATAPEVNEKRKATNLERYGCENPWGNEEVQAKIKETWIKKYGGPNPMYDIELVKLTSERQQQTMIEKYGVNASILVPEIKEKIIATNMERYGVPWYWLKDGLTQTRISSHNKIFGEWLTKLGLSYQFEFVVEDRPYDIKLEDSNILIEIDPTITHNTLHDPWNPNKGKDSDYHLIKTQLAYDNGYRCIHVFDWDNSLNILSMLKPKKKIYARQCNLVKIDRRTADIFATKYHLQGRCRGQNIAYGLYYNGELIQMMSFGKPRYNKNYDLELLRLCSHPDYSIVGGPSKLFTHFKQDNPGLSVISYCDIAKFTGEVYEKLGMKLDHISPPAKIWSKNSKYITDNYLRSRGYDQIFKTNYGKGTSNEQLMIENGWLPVYDCGQKVFTYVEGQ